MRNYIFTMKNFLFFIFLVGINCSAYYAQQPEWLRKIKKIEVLKSTKIEVEKLFANPNMIETRNLAVEFKNGWGKEIKYETKYGRLEVWFAAGKCSENKGKPYAYDIAANIVMGFSFFPNEILLENQLGYDLSKFKDDSGSDTGKKYSLETEKLKTTINIENFQISSIEYDISENHKTRLECKDVSVKEPVWFEKLRTLELFKSTRSEIEALFNNQYISEINDTFRDGDHWSTDVNYKTIHGELQVKYSTGKCYERQSSYGYNAPRDTLVQLEFIPTEKADVTELNFDLRKLESDFSSHGGGIITNLKSGISISYYDASKIKLVEISPNNEQEEEFKCYNIWIPQK